MLATMPLRLGVVARVVGAWAATLVLLTLLFGIFGRSGEGVWLVGMLTVASTPLVILASSICFAFPGLIALRPYIWTLAAVLTALIIGTGTFGRAGLLSLLVSVPAAALFLFSEHLWPLKASTTVHNS
jgi:hypothetical protein